MNLHLRNILWVYASTVLAMPITYVIRVLYAHNLSLEDYGIFYGLFGFFAFFGFLRDWGMNNAVNFFANKYIVAKKFDKFKTLFWFNQGVQFVLSVIIGLLLFFCRESIYALIYPKEENIGLLFPLFIIFWILNTVLTTNSIFLTILQNQKANGAFTLMNYSCILFFSVLFFQLSIVTPLIPVQAYLGSVVLVICFSFFYLFRQYRKYFVVPKLYFKKDLFIEVWKYSNQILISGLAGTVFFSTDTLIIQYFNGAESVAFYTTAVSTATLLTIFSKSFRKVINPVVAKIWHKDKQKVGMVISSILNNYLAFILPLVFSFVLFADSFVLAVYGNKFSESIVLVKILVVGVMLTDFNAFIGFGSMGKPKIISFSAIVAGACNLVLSLFFINMIGIAGVALATLFSAFVRFVMLFYFAKRNVELCLSLTNNIKLLISAVCFLLVALILKSNITISLFNNSTLNFLINAIVIFIISIVIYTILLIITGVINRRKLNYLRNILKS